MYEAAKLEIVWEKYKRNMSILDELNANDTIGHVSLIFIGKIAKIIYRHLAAKVLNVSHYKEVIHEVQKSAIDNALFIGKKCTHYWTLFNAFYFSVTGISTV